MSDNTPSPERRNRPIREPTCLSGHAAWPLAVEIAVSPGDRPNLPGWKELEEKNFLALAEACPSEV